MTSERYETLDVLGRDSDGSVTLNWDTQLGRRVVLKRQPRTAASTARVSQLLSCPPHPNLAVVRDDIGDAHEHVLVVDYADGVDLEQLLRTGAMTTEDSLRCAADLTAAVDHLQRVRPPLRHGAICARNVIVSRHGGDTRAVLVGPLLVEPSRDADRKLARRVVSAMLKSKRASSWRRRAAPLVAASAMALVASALTPLMLEGDGPPAASDTPRATATERPPTSSSAVSAVTAAALARRTTTARPGPGTGTAPLEPESRFGGRSRLVVYEHRVELGSAQYPASMDVYRLDQASLPKLQKMNYGEVPQFTHIASLSKGWVFMYSTVDGVMATVPITSDGTIGWADTIKPEPLWSHVVGDGHGLVWLYRRDKGTVETIRHVDGYHTTHERSNRIARGYDLVTALSANRALFYSADDGHALIATAGADGVLAAIEPVQLPPSLSVLVYSGRGFVVGLTSAGASFVLKLVNGAAHMVSRFSIGGSGWNAGTGFDHGFVAYSRAGVTSVFTELDANGALVATRKWRLPVAPIVVEVP